MIKRLVKLVISAGFWGVDRGWKKISRLMGIKHEEPCVILYYHAVTRKDRGRLARQMDALLKFAQPVSIESEPVLDNGHPRVAITFDDGLLCVFENALPELSKRNIPSTIFVPTGYLGQFPNWMENTQRRADNGKVVTAERLTKDKNELLTIGSHGVTHRNLLLLNESEAKHEIAESKKKLESLLGEEIRYLSFPHGQHNKALVDLCLEAGYQRIFTISPRLAFSIPNEYVTGRFSVEPTDWPLEFRLKCLGAYRWLYLVYKLKKKLRSLLGKNEVQVCSFEKIRGINQGSTAEYACSVDQIEKSEWSNLLSAFDDVSICQTWSYGSER